MQLKLCKYCTTCSVQQELGGKHMTSKDIENGVIHKYVIWDNGKLNLGEKQMHLYISSNLGSILTKRLSNYKQPAVHQTLYKIPLTHMISIGTLLCEVPINGIGNNIVICVCRQLQYFL